MTVWDGYHDVPFEVVRNGEGQYSIWPTTQTLPGGWDRVTGAGPRGECLAYIEEKWTDMRPLSVRMADLRGLDQDACATLTDSVERMAGLRGPAAPRSVIPVHLLIERAEGLAGSDIAMRCGDVAISRAELFETSRAWARVLAEEGCEAEVPVAVAIPRGVDALVAILAILQAGAAYVPLSCEDSADRLTAILDDCGQPVIVAADDTAARLASYPGRVLVLSELRERASQIDTAPLAPAAVSMDNLAFIMYTSGTTGQPKGVEGTHRQLANYALWCRAAFPHSPGWWTVLLAPLSFLGSLTNIFTPLLAGWPIEIAPEGSTIDDLLKLLDRVPVGLLKLTPSHIRMMLARGASNRRTAHQFMIGSEPLIMTDELAAWIENRPLATYVNHYGLTETHGCFCHWFCADVPVWESVPIGKPISNVRAHIVDRHGYDVPSGELGELLVTGDSIARGYRDKPSLTAARWIPDRHSATGTRILRTGDLARLRSDGSVEVVGRADRQVKVRGHRVEPSAVEYELRSRPDVAAALVLPHNRDGVMTVVAYLVPEAGAELDPAAIHRALTEQLAPPSVPSRIAVLAEFPMNSNGKVDVAALPLPPPIGPGGDGSSSSGLWSRCDRIVADAYAASLSIDAVGLQDDFFDLGGDSLAAVGVALAVGGKLGEQVPVPTIGCGTVRGYAEMVEGALAHRMESE